MYPRGCKKKRKRKKDIFVFQNARIKQRKQLERSMKWLELGQELYSTI